MPSFLPPIPSAGCGARQDQGRSSLDMEEKLKKKVLMKVPPWEQNTTLKNWVTLKPPSPYRPVVQKRAYPSVIDSLHTKKLSAGVNGRVNLDKLTPTIADADKHSKDLTLMSCTKEELSLESMEDREKECRSTLLFSEQYERTRLWVSMLRSLSVLLEDDTQAAEENKREACKRDDDRRQMCSEIEAQTTMRRHRERFEEELRKQFSQLMPQYNEIRDEIIAEEREDLKAIRMWNMRNRPFGMRFSIDIDGPVRKITKKRVAAYTGNNTRSTQKKILEPLPKVAVMKTMNDSWPDAFPENTYLEEGRKAWYALKNIMYLQRKGLRSTREVEEMEEAFRDSIRADEAITWMPITAAKVDEYYIAKQAELERDKEELARIEQQLEELKKRETIRHRLEIEARNSETFPMYEEKGVPTASSLSSQGEQVKNEKRSKRERRKKEGYSGYKNNRMERKIMSTENEMEWKNEEVDVNDVLQQGNLMNSASDECHLSNDGSTSSPLYPMLDMVLGVALEHDPLAVIRNPFLSALGEAEWALAALEGRRTGNVANAVAIASRLPLCPAYLSCVLWSHSQEDIDDGPVAQAEVAARQQLVREQMDKVWELYQMAAADASRVSGTECSEAYYLGVQLPEEYMEMLE